MRFITAQYIFSGTDFLEPNSVLVLDSEKMLIDIVKADDVNSSQIEQFEHILCPGFINAHCHLELSHMQNIVPEKTGLTEFAMNIITKRNHCSVEEIEKAMKNADRLMQKNGIVAVGDISNTSVSFETKKNSKLYYHTFIELIGLDPEKSSSVFENGLSLLSQLHKSNLNGSMAAHAPYSTSGKLIQLINEFDKNNNLSFSIHNQESEEENRFLQGKESKFHELFKFLNMDISWFKPKYSNSLNSYSALLKAERNILVHNTFADMHDVTNISNSVYFCLCPSANLYIENQLPNFNKLFERHELICFGTDSLASNSTLDLIKEANIVLAVHPHLKPEHVLKALTYNGAKALGTEDKFGQIKKGRKISLNHVMFNNNKLQLIEVIN